MANFKQNLKKLKLGKTLTEIEAYEMQQIILGEMVETNEILEVFESMSDRIATAEELTGILKASRESMKQVEVNFPTLDTCSTGGDGIQTFNISTLSAIVCASLGAPVAKHGNKSATSTCGSFDLLEKLGVHFQLDPEMASERLKKHGLVFLFAPNFHPAFRFVKEARQKFGKKTYFNFLGPLLNPTRSQFQVIGVSDKKMIPAMGKALIYSGTEKVWLLQGEDGLNEITPTSRTQVWEFRNGTSKPEEFWLNPEEYGISLHPISQIECNDIDSATEIFGKVLRNKTDQAKKDTVILNTAAGLYVFGKVKNYLDGVNLAREAIENGMALAKFQDFVSDF